MFIQKIICKGPPLYACWPGNAWRFRTCLSRVRGRRGALHRGLGRYIIGRLGLLSGGVICVARGIEGIWEVGNISVVHAISLR